MRRRSGRQRRRHRRRARRRGRRACGYQHLRVALAICLPSRAATAVSRPTATVTASPGRTSTRT
eukprot:scaffold91609_cov18-Phaeocystis_antarctica.AAC.1